MNLEFDHLEGNLCFVLVQTLEKRMTELVAKLLVQGIKYFLATAK